MDARILPIGPEYIVILTALGVVMVLGVVVLPTILGLRHARRLRDLEHAERMAEIQMGLAAPRGGGDCGPNKVCVAIGARVPTTAFFVGLAATMVSGHDAEGVWAAVATVGATAVICATLLALRLSRPPARPADPAAKPPAYDPEAFDFATRRG